MAKVLGKALTLVSALAFVGCSAGMSVEDNKPVNTVDGTGGVDFNLDIPNGESIDEILLHLVCADGVDQTHTLDVVNGEVVAGFGGLTPGQCTATMTSQTPDGTDCIGEEVFTVVEGATTPVTVTLMCQGTNDAGGGSVRVKTEFEMKACNVDRIKKIWAIPANLLEGESTSVEVEAWPGTLVETANPATWSFEVVSGGSVSGGGSCSGDACTDFTCGAVPPGAPVNPDTLLPTNVVTVEVRVEDDDCYDTETVFVECGQASVCPNGTQEGLEECDGTDGVGPNQACDANCNLLVCGDGVVNVLGEQCDGTAGVGPNQHCDSSCQLVNDPYCGDNITNGSEQCDGSSLPYSGAVCNGSCQIVPTCNNGHVEGTEQCDLGAGNGPYPATCSTSCTTNSVPNLCKNCITAAPDLQFLVTPCLADSLCVAALDCMTADPGDCAADPLTGVGTCYCGVGNTLDCTAAGFNPGVVAAGHPNIGACWQEMKNAAGVGATNADVVDRVFNTTYPLGNAGQLVDFGYTQYCVAECN